MTPESAQLYALAAHVAVPFVQLPNACAAMVTGSVAKGLADAYSDIDMSIFYTEALPDAATLAGIRERLGGGPKKWGAGAQEEGVVIEAFDLAGLEVQMIHRACQKTTSRSSITGVAASDATRGRMV